MGPAPSCVLGGTGCAQPGNRVSPAEERADPHFQKGFPLPAPLGGVVFPAGGVPGGNLPCGIFSH